jgi:MFS family permease
MPALAFTTNFLWVMVIGILGPSLPSMVADLGITYAQAGFFFTLLSLGSLVGTSLGAVGSDYLPRKVIYGICVIALAAGLSMLGFARGYAIIALVIFLFSMMGSPIGAIGQSIMLDMFPGKRERHLSFMTLFGALGGLLAPVLVSINFGASLSWRWIFIETSVIAFVVFFVLLAIRIPPASQGGARVSFLTIARHRGVIGTAVLIFVSVASDLGFSYWLAQYFKSELHASLGLSSTIVGVYLVGIIAGRLLIPLLLRRVAPRANLVGGLGIALAAILAFILVPWIPAKIALCALYGFGIGPVFPLLVARGTREFPSQAGAVTGILYACMSLGGMAFPLLVGALAQGWGIGNAYFFCAGMVLILLVAMVGSKEPTAQGGVPEGSERSAST